MYIVVLISEFQTIIKWVKSQCTLSKLESSVGLPLFALAPTSSCLANYMYFKKDSNLDHHLKPKHNPTPTLPLLMFVYVKMVKVKLFVKFICYFIVRYWHIKYNVCAVTIIWANRQRNIICPIKINCQMKSICRVPCHTMGSPYKLPLEKN